MDGFYERPLLAGWSFFVKEENNQLRIATELLSHGSNQLTFRVAIGFLIIGPERDLID